MRILLVDDDEIVNIAVKRFTVRNAPANGEHTSRWCPSVEQAIRVSRAWREPHIVLLDLGFPTGSGEEFLEALEENPEHRDRVAVVVMSNYDQDTIESLVKNHPSVAAAMTKDKLANSLGAFTEMLALLWKELHA